MPNITLVVLLLVLMLKSGSIESLLILSSLVPNLIHGYLIRNHNVSHPANFHQKYWHMNSSSRPMLPVTCQLSLMQSRIYRPI